jgi:ABC-type phosphate/phosphonate transport system permease subunit
MSQEYKILHYEYVSPVPLVLSQHIIMADLAILIVVIETGIGGWKAYQAIIPYTEEIEPSDPDILQGVAAHGKKLPDAIAIPMFPQFKPDMYNK